jgi:sugar (pentulose or hexulose) kinase
VTVLGIDVGTSGTRAVVVDVGGTVVASAAEPHAPFASPQPAWAEQDPGDWWRACTIAVRAALDRMPAGDGVAAVGLSGQMHGAVTLDANGEPTRPAPIWSDQRTEAQCAALNADIGAPVRGIEGGLTRSASGRTPPRPAFAARPRGRSVRQGPPSPATPLATVRSTRAQGGLAAPSSPTRGRSRR